MTNRIPALLLAFALGHAGVAIAQEYPAPGRPVRLISPYPAGGSNDITTRLIAQKLSERWGQQVIAENRAGAQNRIATEQVAKSPPDGYLLLMCAAPHGVNPALFEKLPYDTLKDFAAVAHVVSAPVGLWVPASSPFKTVRDLIDFARANPGRLSIGSPGNASAPHLFIELFKQRATVDALHVPMRGDAPLVTELLGGRLDVASSGLAAFRPHVATGKVRGLGIASTTRAPGLEQWPTIAEQGIAGTEASAWFGIVAAAATPPAIIAKINRDVNAILQSPDVRERLDALGMLPVGGPPEAFQRHIAAEIEKWTAVVKAANIKAD